MGHGFKKPVGRKDEEATLQFESVAKRESLGDKIGRNHHLVDGAPCALIKIAPGHICTFRYDLKMCLRKGIIASISPVGSKVGESHL